MSNKEKVTEKQEEKVMTKYDQKMQKRKEAKEQEKRNKRIEMLVWAVTIIALVCLVASFPIRGYMGANETFVKIGGENISKVEFDYNYNVAKNNYYNTYSAYLSLMGVDFSADLSTQMFSDTMTWEDYFEQQTVDIMSRGKTMKAEAEAAGFTCDIKEEYADFVEGLKETAEAVGLSTKDYIAQAYGSYATMGRIKEFVEESLYINAYYNKLCEDNAPSDEAIQEHYDANKDGYDSVDYYLTTITAELPTEPTDLADPVEETEETTETTEETYEPSEAEIEKAMADAKVLAEEAVATVTTDGELAENAKYSGTSNWFRDWLFDASRTEGDTTVVEDTTNNQYYVLSFVKRYLDQTPTANVRIIAVEGTDGQAILDEWKSGEATEESFGALADKYNEGSSFTAEGGYYEAIYPSGTLDIVAAWLFEEGRAAGDTTSVTTEDETYSYVLYYVGDNDPEWKLTIRQELIDVTLESYLQEISKDIEVEDINGNLEYIEILAAEEAVAESEAETEAVETETTETEAE